MKTPFFIRCKVIGGSLDLLDKFISKTSSSFPDEVISQVF